MNPIKTLYQTTDAPVCVCAAGPNAEEDMMQPLLYGPMAYLIGVNHHCDYYLSGTSFNVFTDTADKHETPEFYEMVNTPGRRISPHNHLTDYDLSSENYPKFGFTAPLAIWLGLYVTTGPVFLAGFDLWQSKDNKTHFYKHEPEQCQHLGNNLEGQLMIWDSILDTLDRDRLIVFSGPLTNILQSYR